MCPYWSSRPLLSPLSPLWFLSPPIRALYQAELTNQGAGQTCQPHHLVDKPVSRPQPRVSLAIRFCSQISKKFYVHGVCLLDCMLQKTQVSKQSDDWFILLLCFLSDNLSLKRFFSSFKLNMYCLNQVANDSVHSPVALGPPSWQSWTAPWSSLASRPVLLPRSWGSWPSSSSSSPPGLPPCSSSCCWGTRSSCSDRCWTPQMRAHSQPCSHWTFSILMCLTWSCGG